MEHAEISLHQVKVYECVAQSKRWMTNKEIAEVTGVAPRSKGAYKTARGARHL